MSNKISYKSFENIPKHSLVAPDTNSNEVKLATSGTDLIMGVSDDVDTTKNNPVDVQHYGIAKVVCGGNVKTGEAFTSDDKGRAIKAKTGDNIGGIMLEDGSEGEVCYCNIVIQRAIADAPSNATPSTPPTQV